MRLRCLYCGKTVSTEVPSDTVVRAALVCPECLEKEDADLVAAVKDLKLQWDGTQRPPMKNVTTVGLKTAVEKLVSLVTK